MVYDETDRIRRLYHWECNTKGGGWGGGKKGHLGPEIRPKTRKKYFKKIICKKQDFHEKVDQI